MTGRARRQQRKRAREHAEKPPRYVKWWKDTRWPNLRGGLYRTRADRKRLRGRMMTEHGLLGVLP